tara:strand:- start:63 stop:341 length:279 start_codon:yes stop_codon:yes gene_type:complete
VVNRDGYGRGGEEAGMVELFRTNDPVLLSWMQARLAALDVPAQVFDTHASFMDGNVLAIQRRIMVDEGDLARARRVIAEAEEIARGDRDPLD